MGPIWYTLAFDLMYLFFFWGGINRLYVFKKQGGLVFQDVITALQAVTSFGCIYTDSKLSTCVEDVLYKASQYITKPPPSPSINPVRTSNSTSNTTTIIPTSILLSNASTSRSSIENLNISAIAATPFLACNSCFKRSYEFITSSQQLAGQFYNLMNDVYNNASVTLRSCPPGSQDVNQTEVQLGNVTLAQRLAQANSWGVSTKSSTLFCILIIIMSSFSLINSICNFEFV